MSSYAEVVIVVEGQAEQTFIREVLAPEMSVKGVFLQAALIGKPGHKGGNIRFERARMDIGRFLKQRPNTYICTMFDYSRIEPSWPGMVELLEIINSGKKLSAEEKGKKVEKATLTKIGELFPNDNVDTRFIPYIEMHEFEALLFSDTTILANRISVEQAKIDRILTECGEPEEIDDGLNTAPSRRLISLCDGYRKVAMGKTVSGAIGIPTIRNKCRHFDSWITKLEQLA